MGTHDAAAQSGGDGLETDGLGAGGSYCVRLAGGARFGPVDGAGLAKWAEEGRVPADAMIEADDGTAPRPAASIAALRPYFVAPPTVGGAIARSEPDGDTAMGGLIPYRNGMALAGYYVAVFSLIPGLALVLGVVAVVLGVLGLKAAAARPRIKGRAHAWVAIVLGGLTFLVNAVMIVFFLGR